MTSTGKVASYGSADSAVASRRNKIRIAFSTVNVRGALFVVALILVWQLVVSTGILHSQFFPSPAGVLSATTNSALMAPLLHTLLATTLGWLISSVVGLTLGLLMGTFFPVWQYSMASVDVIRSIPAIVFIPVFALIFGISLKAEIAVIVYVSGWPVLLSALAGMQQVGAGLRDSARILRLSRTAYILKIALPSAMPEILVGLRLGMGLALTLSIAGELLINPAGLGYALLQAQQRIQPQAMYMYVILIGIVGFLLNTVLLLVARLVLPRPVRGEALKAEQAAA